MTARTRRLTGASLCVTLLAATLAACGSGDDADAEGGSGELAEVTVMAFPGQSYRLPFLVGDQKGFFEDRGISFEFIDQPNNLSGAQGMAATKADVAFISAITQAQGAQAGQSYPFFCGGIKVLQTTLIADTDSDLPSTEEGASWQEVLQSLKGKKVGIQTPVGSGLQIFFSEALREAGVGEDEVTLVNLGATPTTVQAALQNGSVDVAQINPPGTQLLAVEDYGKPLIYMSQGPEVYKNSYGSGVLGDPAWLESDPEVAEDFCAAYDEALTWIQDDANTEEAAGILAEDTGVSQEAAELVVTDTFDDFSSELDDQTMQTTYDAYVDLGIVKPEPALTTDELVVHP